MRSEPEPITSIRPPEGWPRLELRELWEYRGLLYFLMWRDVKVRYRQTALGAAWAIIQPFFTMVVFSVFFGWLARMPSDGVPYPVFAYTGLVPWIYFANALALSSNSLVLDERLVTKVYFPRVLIPVAAVLSGLLDLAIASVVLIGMLVAYGLPVTPLIAGLPVFVLLATTTALGAGLWLAALNVQYRDVRYAIPFLVQFWLFATPIAYPSSLVPDRWRPVLGLNPMAGVVEGFRWLLLGRDAPVLLILVSLLTAGGLLATALFYFKKMEDTFADVV